MLKKLSMFFIVAALFVFCKSNTETANQKIEQIANIASVDSLLQYADAFVGKTVETRGMVSHVCRMSGKKLFILGKNPEQMIKVTTGSNITQFDIALEGSKVLVRGEFVKQIVGEQPGGHEQQSGKADSGGVECATEQQALYSIECSYYKEL